MNWSVRYEQRDYERFLLLLAALLSGQIQTAAQTATAKAVPTQERTAPSMARAGTVSGPLLAASLLLYEDTGKSPVRFSHLFGGTYDRELSLANLSPIVEVRTLFLTQSSVPLLDLWGGRLRLDAFTSRLHMQNAQLGPSAAGGLRDFRPPRVGYASGPRSVGLSGISLSFHFGRDAQIGRPDPIWRCLARIVSPH